MLPIMFLIIWFAMVPSLPIPSISTIDTMLSTAQTQNWCLGSATNVCIHSQCVKGTSHLSHQPSSASKLYFESGALLCKSKFM